MQSTQIPLQAYSMGPVPIVLRIELSVHLWCLPMILANLAINFHYHFKMDTTESAIVSTVSIVVLQRLAKV